MEAGQKPASPAHFLPKKCIKMHILCTHSPKKVLQFFPRPPPLFWQKVKKLPPPNPKTVASLGFLAQTSIGSGESGVFDLFAKKSSGLWGHKGTIRKTQKPQKPDASRSKSAFLHEVQKSRLSRAFWPKAKRKNFWPKTDQVKAFLAEGQKVPAAQALTPATVYAFAEGKSGSHKTPETCVKKIAKRFFAKSVILPICPRKKRSKKPQKNDRSRLVKNGSLLPFLAVPLPFFGQKVLNFLAKKIDQKTQTHPQIPNFPQILGSVWNSKKSPMKGGKTPPFIRPFFRKKKKGKKRCHPALGCEAPQSGVALFPKKKCAPTLGKNPKNTKEKVLPHSGVRSTP